MPPRPTASRTAAASPEAAARRLGGERLARGLALRGVEPLVAVLVELRDDRALAPPKPPGPNGGGPWNRRDRPGVLAWRPARAPAPEGWCVSSR